MSKTQRYIFISLFVLLVFLLFFRLSRHDMLTDDGHYALRSLGYFDYLGSLEQTTPVQWFGERPWWSYLGFHDHPFLFFLVQHVFFKIFGATIFVSRLPSAVAAIGTAIAVFFIGRKLGGVKAGLIALGALVLNSYFIWMGRIGLLESVFTFFFTLGLYYFMCALDDSRHFWKAGLFWGLAVLTKYTFLFFILGILIFILWKNRHVFKDKKFWLGIAVFLITSLPILIYNLGMLQARGHFDVQFSDFFGQVHNDWPKLAKRVSFTHLDFSSVLTTLAEGFSWPYFAVFVSSFFAAIFFFRKSPKLIIPLLFASPLVFFFFIGGAERWLGVLTPFSALTIGLVTSEGWKRRNYLWYLGLAVLGSFCLFYTLNTNNFIAAKGSKNLYASFRAENYGYNQLDKAISELLIDKQAPENIRRVMNAAWYNRIRPEAINFASLEQGTEEFNAVIVYDSNSVWFATVWIFEKWKLYRRIFIPSSEEFIAMNESELGREILQKLSSLQIYFVRAGEEISKGADLEFPEQTRKLAEIFEKQNIKPKIVLDDLGREAFYIYKGVLN